MAVGIRLTGNPAAATPSTARPGGAASPSNPIQDRIQSDAAAQAAWANMASPGGVPDIMAANAARNQNATSSAMGYGASGLSYTQGFLSPNVTSGSNSSGPQGWNQASRAAFSNARADNSNRDYIASGTRADANAENRNRDYVANGTRANASYENQERDRIARQTRQEADYEQRDRNLAQIRIRRMEYEQRQEAVYENRDHDLATAKERRDDADMRREAGAENRDHDARYRSTRQAAEYENRDQDRAYAQMRKQADYENAAFDRANAPPGGGRGGGGGNLLGTIGGWGGMRNTGNLLGGGGFGPAMAAEIGKELFFLPQTISNIEGKWLGATAQARNYVQSTSIMGQSGGFDSRDFRANLRQAGERGGDDWLLRNGLGVDEAAEMVAGLGVVPRSTEQATSMARNMANSRTTPGMSGIPTGMLTGIMRDMLGIGAVTPDHIGSMNQDLGAIMKQTAATGQDQLKVLRSIDTGVVSLSTAPGATTALGADTLFQANQRFITTPAGMTGAAGAESIASTQSAFSTVGSNPARTIVASGMVDKLKTEGDLRSFFGGDSWDKFTAGPVGREMADTYLHDVKAGNNYGAMLTLTHGLLQDPTLAASADAQNALVNNPVTKQFGQGGGLELATQSNMSNMSEAQVIAFRQSQSKGAALGMAANNPLNLADVGQPGVIGNKTAADGEKVAVFGNMAQGVAASVNQLRRYEQGGLMSPRQLAMKWSGGHASEAYIKSVADSIGVKPDTKVDLNDPNVARAYIEGAQPFESGPGRLSRADVNSGVDLAFSRKSSNPNLREDGSPDPNVPEYNPAVSTAKQGVLSGSETSLHQGQHLNDRVNEMSDAWHIIVVAVEGLATAVRAAASVQGAAVVNALH